MSGGSRFVACGQTGGETDRWTERKTDMTTLILTYRSFANAPKNFPI